MDLLFCWIITAFGTKELEILCKQFSEVLEHANIVIEQVQMEWLMLKSHLYNKWVYLEW